VPVWYPVGRVGDNAIPDQTTLFISRRGSRMIFSRVEARPFMPSLDNVFITQYFDWDQPGSRKFRLANACLSALGTSARLGTPNRTGVMTTTEQRINIFHLVSQVLAYGVAGEFVEVGTFRGTSAVMIQKVVELHGADRRLHVYDSFSQAPEDELLSTFAGFGLRPPVVHAGPVRDTLPGQLPIQIGFAHVDLGPGPSTAEYEASLRLSLASLYPRLTPGAICLLADYCDPDVYNRPGYHFPRSIGATDNWNLFPQVKHACDEFFRDKPETVWALYSGAFSHGFFRKEPPRSA
jgi:O-methyltransferase